MYNTKNVSIDLLSNRNMLLDNMNNFKCKSKELTLLIICTEIPAICLYQMISYAMSNEISIAAMIHVSSASVQLLQLAVGHVNHTLY